jgi:hypothetical protein
MYQVIFDLKVSQHLAATIIIIHFSKLVARIKISFSFKITMLVLVVSCFVSTYLNF